jgi:glycosyltransferase involved in cell wall biosynthesis
MELATELHHRGIEVALATMGDSPTPQQRREAHAIGSLTLHESNYRLEWMDDPWEDIRQAGEWLLYLERMFHPDVIHLNNYVHAALPFQAPTLVVAHSCVLTWWHAVKRTATPQTWAHYEAAVRRGLNGANAVVAPTRAMLEALISVYGRLPRSIVVPNGRRPFAEANPKWPFILSAGRLWDEAKNITLLEEAAPRLSWPVWLAGETSLTQSQPVRRRSNVNLLGQLSFAELANWMSRAAIYALPARYEPFGLSALEAALCGCTLVLGDIPSLREVWGKAALFVSPDDRDELVEVLQRLIDNPDTLQHMGALACERALKYSPENMGDRYVALYHELASPPAQRATRQEATACAS